MPSIAAEDSLEKATLQHISFALVNGSSVCHLRSLVSDNLIFAFRYFTLIYQLLQFEFLSRSHFLVQAFVFIQQMVQTWIHVSELLNGSFYLLLLSCHFKESLRKLLSQFFQMLDGEVIAFVLAAHGACVRALQRVGVQYIVCLSYCDPGATILIRLHFKRAVVVGEGVARLVEDERQDALLQDVLIRVIVIASVHEDVLSARMAMKIGKHVDDTILERLLDHFFCSHDLRSLL